MTKMYDVLGNFMKNVHLYDIKLSFIIIRFILYRNITIGRYSFTSYVHIS